MLSLPGLLALWHLPEVRGAIPPGGMLGHMIAEGMSAALNTVGANLVLLAVFFTSLFLTTQFSFSAAHKWMRVPMDKLDPIGRIRVRWENWKEEREETRRQKRLEEIKTVGRQPIASQVAIAKTALASPRDEAGHEEVEAEDDGAREGIVLVQPQDSRSGVIEILART